MHMLICFVSFLSTLEVPIQHGYVAIPVSLMTVGGWVALSFLPETAGVAQPWRHGLRTGKGWGKWRGVTYHTSPPPLPKPRMGHMNRLILSGLMNGIVCGGDIQSVLWTIDPALGASRLIRHAGRAG